MNSNARACVQVTMVHRAPSVADESSYHRSAEDQGLEGTAKEQRGSERERTSSSVQTAVDFILDHNEAMTSKLEGKLCPA